MRGLVRQSKREKRKIDKSKYDEVAEEVRKNYLKREPDMEEIREAFYRLREQARIDWPSGR